MTTDKPTAKTTAKEATPAQDKEGVFAATNPAGAAFAVKAGYAVPFISDEAKFAASEAARKAASAPAPKP